MSHKTCVPRLLHYITRIRVEIAYREFIHRPEAIVIQFYWIPVSPLLQSSITRTCDSAAMTRSRSPRRSLRRASRERASPRNVEFRHRTRKRDPPRGGSQAVGSGRRKTNTFYDAEGTHAESHVMYVTRDRKTDVTRRRILVEWLCRAFEFCNAFHAFPRFPPR